jgi:hypothetical protein
MAAKATMKLGECAKQAMTQRKLLAKWALQILACTSPNVIYPDI